MKRSEMLKIIANKLELEKIIFNRFGTFRKTELEISEVILSTIEEAGMLPPLVTTYDQENGTGAQNGYTPVQYLAWERESE